MLRLLYACVLLYVPQGFLAVASATLDVWHVRKPVVVPYDLYGVASGPEGFVVVGDWGAVLTSPDGLRWENQLSSTEAPLRSISYGNGRYVAVSPMGTAVVSPDGTRWTAGSAPGGACVRFCAGRFIAVGPFGAYSTSTDGMVWTEGEKFTSRDLRGIDYGNDTFVVVGQGGSFASTNGVDWIRVFPTVDWAVTTSVAFGDGRFVVGAYSGMLSFSSDGLRWQPTMGGYADSTLGVAYGNGKFVSVGNNNSIATSEHPAQWRVSATIPKLTTIHLQGVAHGHERFVAVGTDGNIMTSPTGDEWTLADPSPPNRSSVAYGNGKFVSPSDRGYLVSEDGVSWHEVETPHTSGKVNFVNGIFFGMGFGSLGITVSGDGRKWTPIEIIPPSNVHAVAYGRDRFVAVSTGGVYSSADGVTWTHSTGLFWGFDIAHNKERFVAVGGTKISSSDNGVDWAEEQFETKKAYVNLQAIAYGNGRFVAVGYGGLVLTSSNGSSWSECSVGDVVAFGDICFAGERFVAVGWEGDILSSRDGEQWTRHESGVRLGLHSVTFGNDCFLVAGSGGLILQSDPLVVLRGEADHRQPCFRLHVQGAANGGFRIEESSDLRTWGVSAGMTNVPGSSVWQQPGLPGHRFFRVKVEDRR